MNQKRQLLVGIWESTHQGEIWLLELRSTGEYVLIKNKVKDRGVWGISGAIYFNLNQKSASVFQNYKILKLTPDAFEFMNPDTGETFSFRRHGRAHNLK